MRGGGIIAVVALLAAGCATNRRVSASGKPIPPEAFAQAERLVAEQQVPDDVRALFIARAAEGRENECLHAMRAGLACLRLGHLELAARTFDDAISDVEAFQEGTAQARRAKSKFVGEQEKWFKGESYERAALYLYRGFLYLQVHDFGNAAACFKRAQIQDITGDDAPGFAGDWYSAELALALASHKNGVPDDAANALQRAAKFTSKSGEVSPPQPDHNLLIVVEVGQGPEKYRDGRYGEKLRFMERRPAIVHVRAGNTESPAAENLYLQATTRGTRQVDYILAGKANFKAGTQTAAAVLATGALIASQHDDSGIATGVLGGLALISAIASGATQAQADVRAWDNLPHSVYLLSLQAPLGESAWEVTGLDAHGGEVSRVTIKPVLQENDPLEIVFVRF